MEALAAPFIAEAAAALAAAVFSIAIAVITPFLTRWLGEAAAKDQAAKLALAAERVIAAVDRETERLVRGDAKLADVVDQAVAYAKTTVPDAIRQVYEGNDNALVAFAKRRAAEKAAEMGKQLVGRIGL